jgi:anti-anti-sigma factor
LSLPRFKQGFDGGGQLYALLGIAFSLLAMEINLKKERNTIIIAVKGRMDAVCATDFDQALEEQIRTGENQFILDFSSLEYISSAGLQCILAVAKNLEAKEGRIVLAALRGTVNEVFEISGFNTMFSIFESVEDALNAQ